MVADAENGGPQVTVSKIAQMAGNPVYNHAVVVDDHDMGITHVIRGVDHLTNAARQVQIYRAMGWEVPVFAHVPLIHGPDGAKLSKRHGSPAVEATRTPWSRPRSRGSIQFAI